MPKLLKKDSIRLIEASIEALGLAQIGICTFRREDLKIGCVRYAAEIGLIGSSIELAMNSVLVQAFGGQFLIKEELGKSRYKTASEILHDFRNLLKQSSAVTFFLVNGISDCDKHISELISLTNRFQIIITGRAHGLHSGIGLSYEITASLFQEVSRFLKLLSESNNFKPYLHKVPELIGIQIDKNILVDDLYRRVNQSNDINEQKIIISSLFLILPEIPQDLPQWTENFQSFNIAPKKNDIVYLINALERANPVSLKKVKDGANTINVKIVSGDNTDAIPIAQHYLKTAFTQLKDQIYSSISLANGQLESGTLDLPPISFIYKMFSIDLNKSDILDEGEEFTAHQSWPFIVSALNVAKNNINAPIWFIIRKTGDLGQLKALLTKASKLGNESLKNNIQIVIDGLESIKNGKVVDTHSSFYNNLLVQSRKFEEYLDTFCKAYSKNKNYELKGDYIDFLNHLFEEEIYVSVLLKKIISDNNLSIESKKYWVSQLSQVMPTLDDLPTLIEILANKEFANSHTNIRKVLRSYDFYLYGPKIK